jgi:hypothetical protein
MEETFVDQHAGDWRRRGIGEQSRCDETILKHSGHHFVVATKSPRNRIQLSMLDRPTKETIMTAAIAKAFSSVIPTVSTDADSLKTIGLFCAAGLLVSLLMASYGLDFGAF